MAPKVKCVFCHKKLIRKSLPPHMSKHTREKPSQCSYCLKEFSNKYCVIKHIKLYHRRHESFDSKASCLFCERQMNPYFLPCHLSSHTAEKPFICYICLKEFSSNQALSNHVRYLHNKEKLPHTCKYCGKRFLHITALKLHHERMHSTVRPYKCDKCQKTFKSNVELKSHMRFHSERKPYQCKHCPAAFRHNNNLAAHSIIHVVMEERPRFQCDECDCVYLNKMSLVQHKKFKHNTSTAVNPHFKECVKCDKRFWNNFELKKHLMTHTGEKPHKCEICDKRFRQKCHLEAHIFTHTGEKPFMCKDCPKAFRERTRLNNHIKQTHRGVQLKREECIFCKKTFRALKLHLIFHTKEKPYDCSLCDRSFTTSSERNVHIRSHLKEKYHKCSNCGKEFVNKRNLGRHEKRFH